MNDFKKKVKKVKKVPGPNLTNSRNYAYSTGCDYSTKRVPRGQKTEKL